MEENVYRVVKNVIWGTVVLGSITAGCINSYFCHKNDNEHYVEKERVKIERIEKVAEISSRLEYQKYLELRRDLGNEIIEEDPTILTGIGGMRLRNSIDSVLGNHVLK